MGRFGQRAEVPVGIGPLMARAGRVFGILLCAALAAAVLAPGQLAAWADAHADRPGGEALAAGLHRWDDALAPLGAPRRWVRARFRDALDAGF